MKSPDIAKLIEEYLEKNGFSHFGFSPLESPLSMEYYRQWLSEGLHGNMQYLVDHADIKEKPQLKWLRAESALVFAIPYFPHPEPNSETPLKSARTSLYAQGMDYHHWFRARMQTLCDFLISQFPTEEFLPFTDSSPILERDLARRAGLGFVGKNTCLIHPKKGSLFFIGEIYTSLKIESTPSPLPDFCGTCTRCIDICPTGALIEPKKMDARKCISYLTIESREVPDVSLRDKIGDWFFGCDLCQTVCPWNQKIFKNTLSTELVLTLEPQELQQLEEDLRYILQTSGKQLQRDFKGTPLERAGSFGLKRNALVVAGNRKIKALTEDIKTLVDHEKLGELAHWALEKITSH